MRTRIAVLVVGIACAIVSVGVAGAAPEFHNRDTVRYWISLRPQSVVPPSYERGAHGQLTAKLVIVRGRPLATLSWKLDYSGVGTDVSAHIHKGRPGRTGPEVIELCSPCRSGQRAQISLPAPLARAISGSDFWPGGPRRAYVDLHTPRRPDGALRGALEVGSWRGDIAPG